MWMANLTRGTIREVVVVTMLSLGAEIIYDSFDHEADKKKPNVPERRKEHTPEEAPPHPSDFGLYVKPAATSNNAQASWATSSAWLGTMGRS
jgi:hypothetical protein